MSSDPLGGPILLLLLLILLHAFLNWLEAAAVSLNETRLRRDAEEGNETAEALLPMAADQERVCASLRVCVTMAGLLCSALATVCFVPLLRDFLHGLGLTDGTVILSSLLVSLLLCWLLLSMATLVPRRLALRNPERVALRWQRFMRLTASALRPFTWLGQKTAALTLRLFGLRGEDELEEVTEDDILDMVGMGGESGTIEENEKELIENIFEFNNKSAEDVMTHRTDVTAIWVDEEEQQVVEAILDSGFSRFPVYREDMDDIIGILNTRDFLLNRHAAQPKPLRELLREAYFVPETVQADVLFRDMQKRKVHMAIVVDEYGGMSGVVTMEDLLEEIVGNIYDEFDPQAEAEIVQTGENTWRISGSALLEDINEALDTDLPTEEDYDTLGGLIFSQMTAIPEDGSHPEMDVGGLHIRVEELAEHRVEYATVTRTDDIDADWESES